VLLHETEPGATLSKASNNTHLKTIQVHLLEVISPIHDGYSKKRLHLISIKLLSVVKNPLVTM
jgi:hypothetical protein